MTKLFLFHSEKVNKLLVFQLITHLALIPMIIYGDLWHWVIAFLIYTLWVTVGASATFHRLLSHKSYQCSKWWEWFGTLCCTLGGVGSSITWTAIHRQHHRYTDKPLDPHSPLHQGVLKVQFLIMMVKPNIRYVPDLLRDKFHVFMHNYYWLVHLCYAIICYLVEPFAVIYAYLMPALFLWHAGGLINTLGHKWGYKNYPADDSSVNNLLTGYFVGGEGWHNNHHADPKNYMFGHKWWELDLAGIYIRLIKQ